MDFITQGLIEAFWLLWHLDPETLSAIIITLKSSSFSILCALIIGLPLGFALGYFEFPGRRALKLLSDTLLAIPTVVVGLIIYALISYRGPLGQYELLYTIKGIVMGQTLLALPIIISLTAATIEGMDRKLYLTLLSFRPTPLQMIRSVAWELRHALVAVIVTAYGRVVAEVGVAMMIGGEYQMAHSNHHHRHLSRDQQGGVCHGNRPRHCAHLHSLCGQSLSPFP